jgi:putative endonuclease
VYILECADGSYYTGFTLDLDGRMTLHQAGRASRYTRSRLPVRLVYSEICSSRSSAMRRERQIKQLPRVKKAELVNSESD